MTTTEREIEALETYLERRAGHWSQRIQRDRRRLADLRRQRADSVHGGQWCGACGGPVSDGSGRCGECGESRGGAR